MIRNRVEDRKALAQVKAAIQDLMLRFPLCGLSYLGEAVEVEENLSLETLATDGRLVMYSPKWIQSCDERGRIFDLLHEWLHIFNNHPARIGDRNPAVWNTACDMVVVRGASELLSRPGDPWPWPTNGVIPQQWSQGLTAEEIYDRLISTSPNMPPPPRCAFKPAPPSNTPQDNRFREVFSGELAQAALIQEQVQNRPLESIVGATMAKRLEEIKQGRLPWGRMLRGDLLYEITGGNLWTYSKPSRRSTVDIVFPSIQSRSERSLLIGVDVSASVGASLFSEFKSNVKPAAMRAQKVTVVTFDQVIREEIQTSRPDQVLDSLKFKTGWHSHTDARGVFEIADRIRPTATVIFTDGAIMLPTRPYPKTLWVIPEGGHQLPWGRHYVMNYAW